MKLVHRNRGAGAGVVIPAVVAGAAKLDRDACEEAGHAACEPIRERAYDLDELVRAITAENLHAEVDFGATCGGEML